MPPEEIGLATPDAERPGILTGLVRFNRYLLLLLIIPAAVIGFWPPYKEQESARQRLAVLELQRDAYKYKATRLEKKLGLIRDDPEYLEAMARDRLQLQRDGEIILRFED